MLDITHAKGNPGATETQDSTQQLNQKLWYKDAVIYQLHVKAFHDSNGDGIGDFRGLVEKLDYIHDLGVNAIWLLPFYPSPLRDDGYDIADYHGVHANYGTRADFKQFVREAHRRGLKVISELVINHTSDQHPWFQAARAAPAGSNKRNYYVWSETAKKWEDTRVIFVDTESSNWTWDNVAGAYYWHRFFSHQPDLNFDNPAVVRAVMRVMRYWFDLGVDGMRLDAIPYLCERDGTNNENLPETHAVLKQLRAELDRLYPDRFFLAEVNQWPEDVREYFGNGDECHVAYHFPLMPRIYMAVAEEDRHPIIDIMSQTPEIPENCQWAVFLRNHDELTLEMVTARERDYMYHAYATDRRMRVNVGIRRRLAPLMDNNRRKIELVNSLLMSVIGSPIVYYGDEIGMGDNFYLGDRHGMRTPMQWSPDRNAGFSRADPQSLYLPPIMDPVYGYPSVNVEAQNRNTSSLLHWMKRLIAVRKTHPAFGRGDLRFLHPGNRKVLAYIREWQDEIILCVANLARSSQPVELDLHEYNGRVPVELLGDTSFPPIGDLPYLLTLPAWGFYWFALRNDAQLPSWHEERPLVAELPTLILPQGLSSMLSTVAVESDNIRGVLRARTMNRLCNGALPSFLSAQRWFSGKGRTVTNIALAEQSVWNASDLWLFAFADVHFSDGQRQRYTLPLALAWEDQDYERVQQVLHSAVARVRQRGGIGILYDALWDDNFCYAILASLSRNEIVNFSSGKLAFHKTSAFTQLITNMKPPIRRPAMEQSNSLLILGDAAVLKLYRRPQPGINPEVEIGRFLTEMSPYQNIAPMAGWIDYEGATNSVTVGILNGYIDNQGSGWDYVLDYLGRYLEASLAQPLSAPPSADGVKVIAPTATEAAVEHPQAAFQSLMSTLGKRTGELHVAFARITGDSAFDLEPITADDVDKWHTYVSTQAENLLKELASKRSTLPARASSCADLLFANPHALKNLIIQVTPRTVAMTKSRCHGDYHLGQVLMVNRDFVIVDFEGEPAKTVAERRAKTSPLRDVAGMLRSFAYAAAVSIDKATADRPQDREKLTMSVATWKSETEKAFLEGYRNATNETPCDINNEIAQQLIHLFTLEKVLYETLYELDNRPEWTHIPLTHAVAMITRA